MDTRTRRGIFLVVVLVMALAAGVVGFVVVDMGGSPDPLTRRWVSDTARPVGGNHHAVAAARVAGEPLVVAPISGEGNSDQCALMALDATDGSVRWADEVPSPQCTIHSVADPAVADLVGDDRAEVIAATTEETVKAYDPLTGDVEFTYPLSAYGYTQPIVEDVTGTSTPELIVVDVTGSVFVVHPNGTAVWERRFSTFTWGQPAVSDIDADGSPEIVVALSRGGLYLFNAADGTVRWNRSLEVLGSVTWVATGQVDTDEALEIVTATTEGRVSAYDGRAGTRQWTATVADFASVHAIADGDGDGAPEVYAAARDGVVRAINGSTGRIEWHTRLTEDEEQMMAPPVLGDLDGEGSPELVAATNGGRIVVLNAESGSIVGSHHADARIWTHPTLADTDADGRPEIYVMYGDGRVGAFAFEGG